MKMMKILAVAGVGLAAAATSYAAPYSYVIGGGEGYYAVAGQQGVIDINLYTLYRQQGVTHSTYQGYGAGTYNVGALTVTPQAGTPFTDYSGQLYDQNGNPISSFSTSGSTAHQVAGNVTGASIGDYYEVTFNIPLATPSSTWNVGLALALSNAGGNTGPGVIPTQNWSLGGSSATYAIQVTAAPEPSQTLAGAMLLGCGGLIFAGRRLFKQKSA